MTDTEPSGTSFTPPEDMMIVEQGRPSAEAVRLAMRARDLIEHSGRTAIATAEAAMEIDALCAARVAEATAKLVKSVKDNCPLCTLNGRDMTGKAFNQCPYCDQIDALASAPPSPREEK